MKRIVIAIHLPVATCNPCLAYAKNKCMEVSYA